MSTRWSVVVPGLIRPGQLASSGTIARRQPYNYEMGLGSDRPNYQVPGTVTEGITEGFSRKFVNGKRETRNRFETAESIHA